MRTTWLFCLTAGLISVFGTAPVLAQDNSSIDSDIQILRSDIRSDKTKIMADQMQLSDVEGKSFWPILQRLRP